jgi:starvation-inducible outer membrane lipoprotein
LTLLVAVALTVGCSSPISRSVRNEIDREISFQQLREQPASSEGSQVEKIGEVDYVYPLVCAREIHLWQDRSNSFIIYPYPVWYYWDLE